MEKSKVGRNNSGFVYPVFNYSNYFSFLQNECKIMKYFIALMYSELHLSRALHPLLISAPPEWFSERKTIKIVQEKLVCEIEYK